MPRRLLLVTALALTLAAPRSTHAQHDAPSEATPDTSTPVAVDPSTAYSGLQAENAPAALRAQTINEALANLDAALKQAPDDPGLKTLRDLFATAKDSTARISRIDRRALDQIIAEIQAFGPFLPNVTNQFNLRRELLNATQPALTMQPELVELWTNRLSAAIDLRLRREGWQAARALIALKQDTEGSDQVIDALARARRLGWLHNDSAWITKAEQAQADAARAAAAAKQQAEADATSRRFSRWNGTWSGDLFNERSSITLAINGTEPVLERLEMNDTRRQSNITVPGTWAIREGVTAPLTLDNTEVQWITPGESLRITIKSGNFESRDGTNRMSPQTRVIHLGMYDDDEIVVGGDSRLAVSNLQTRQYLREIGFVLKREGSKADR